MQKQREKTEFKKVEREEIEIEEAKPKPKKAVEEEIAPEPEKDKYQRAPKKEPSPTEEPDKLKMGKAEVIFIRVDIFGVTPSVANFQVLCQPEILFTNSMIIHSCSDSEYYTHAPSTTLPCTLCFVNTYLIDNFIYGFQPVKVPCEVHDTLKKLTVHPIQH